MAAEHFVPFSATIEQLDETTWRVEASGDLDLATAERLAATLAEPSSHNGAVVELDLGGVEFLDSSGLRVIVATASRLEARGGRIVLSGLSAAAERVLEVTGLLEALRSGALHRAGSSG